MVAWDPAEGAEQRLRAQIPEGSLRFANSLAEVGAAADLVLESGPERLEVKREIFAALDEAAAPDVLLTSSSSGLMPSTFQRP